MPSEHRDNDRRCDQVQANKRDPAGSRVCERCRGGTRDCREPDSQLDELPTRGGATPVEQGDEHPADDGSHECDQGERRQWDLAVNSQRGPCGAQTNRTDARYRRRPAHRPRPWYGSACRSTTGGVPQLRGGMWQPKTWLFLSFGGGALCTRAPCPRTAKAESTTKLLFLFLSGLRVEPTSAPLRAGGRGEGLDLRAPRYWDTSKGSLAPSFSGTHAHLVESGS